MPTSGAIAGLSSPLLFHIKRGCNSSKGGYVAPESHSITSNPHERICKGAWPHDLGPAVTEPKFQGTVEGGGKPSDQIIGIMHVVNREDPSPCKKMQGLKDGGFHRYRELLLGDFVPDW